VIRWALATLWADRAGGLAAVAGTAVAFVLAMLLEGIFAGEARQMVALIEHSGADLWVMQDGVDNVHMATSVLGARQVDAIAGVEGVAEASPLLYQNAFVSAGGEDWFTYAVGVASDIDRGQPWDVVEGVARPGPGQVLISDVLARRTGLSVGDRVAVGADRFEVAGLTGGTWSMANTVTWLPPDALADMMGTDGGASYVLVVAAPGVDAGALARRIEAEVEGVHALKNNTLVANDTRLGMQMGGQMIGVMRWIGAGIGGLVIAFSVLASTMRRSAELAVAKALGFPARALFAAVGLQAVILAAAGFLVAALLALVGGPLVEAAIAEVTLEFQPATLLRLGGAAIAVAVAAAWLPARRVAAIDPASVFSDGSSPHLYGFYCAEAS